MTHHGRHSTPPPHGHLRPWGSRLRDEQATNRQTAAVAGAVPALAGGQASSGGRELRIRLPRLRWPQKPWALMLVGALVATLAGGGTYALWSISAHFTGGIVHSGGFNLERYGDEQWHDVSFDVLARGDAGPLDGGRDGGGEGGLLVTGPRDAGGIDLDAVLAAGNTIDVADWLIVPGDAVLGIMEADITLNGHNLAAVLSMEARDDQSGGQGGGLFARGGDDRQPGNLAASLFDLIDNDNVSVNISVVARELDDRDQPGATLKEWTVVGHHRDPASDNCPDSEGGGDGEGDKIDIGEGDINLSDGKEFDGTLGMFVAPQTRRGSDGGQGEGEGSRDAGAGTVVTLGPTGRARVYVIVEVYFDLCTPDMVGEGGIELADIADISLTLDQVRSTATPRPNPTGTIGPKPTPTLTTPVEPPADS